MQEPNRFDDSDAKYLEWLRANPTAFVLNVMKKSKTFKVVMHRASCDYAYWERSALGGVTEREYEKIGSLSATDLEQWAAEKKPAAPFSRCRCLSRPA